MNLELNIFNIKHIQFGEKTTIRERVLYIKYQELKGLLIKDDRFSEVDIELAHPGESCRLVQVFDVIEPRAKMGRTGKNFPGALGKIGTAGEGRTRVLRGTAVVPIDKTPGTPGKLVVDMSGPWAARGLYGKLQNIALLCTPVNGIAHADYQNALRIASLKAAVYLAEAGRDLEADEIETYSLGSLAKASNGLEHLPRVAYVYQIHALQSSAYKGQSEPIFYGDNVGQLLPTIVHPNEILDGAIVRGYYCMGHQTYSIQNHPIVRELYKRHGKDLCFVGVVITVGQAKEPEMERSAATAAKLVKSVLGADGAILTKIHGGAPHIDLAQTCELCEELGVKTSLVVADMSTDATSKGALIFNTPRADAIVNVGTFNELLHLPTMERVIGGPMTFPIGNRPAEGEIIVPINNEVSQIGASKNVTREY